MAVDNIKIDKGATFERNITWTDNSGTAIDLTGFTARMQIRKNYKSAIIQELTTENGGITLTALTGEIYLLIEATDTDVFTDDRAIYDLELINGTKVYRVLQGDVLINENVTI